MSTVTEDAVEHRPRWTERSAVAAANSLATVPVQGAGRLAQMLFDRRDQAVWIFVVVAIVVIVAAGGVLAWAYAYCVARGGNFDGGLSASWNPFSVELRFRCTQ